MYMEYCCVIKENNMHKTHSKVLAHGTCSIMSSLDERSTEKLARSPDDKFAPPKYCLHDLDQAHLGFSHLINGNTEAPHATFSVVTKSKLVF